MEFGDIYTELFANGNNTVDTDSFNQLLEQTFYKQEHIRELTEWLYLKQKENKDYNDDIDKCLKTVSDNLLTTLNVGGNRRDKKISFCKVFLYNMLRAYYRRTRIYIPRNNNHNNNKDYFPFTKDIAIKIIDPLVESGYLVKIKGNWNEDKKNNYLSSYYPTNKLIELLLKNEELKNQSAFDTYQHDTIFYRIKSKNTDVTDIGEDEITDVKIQCDKKGLENEFKVINEYNRLRYKSVITFYINTDCEVKFHNFDILFCNSLQIDEKGIITLRKNYATRIFNDKECTKGGRFYSTIESRLAKEIRKNLLIDGSPVVELDYSGLHLRMLYHQINEDYREDPYSGLNETLRPIYKKVALCSINASSEKKATQAIRNEIQKMINKGELKKDDIIRNLEGEVLLENLKDETIKPLIESIKEKHERIKKSFFSGEGIYLQNLDSQIANDVIEYFTEKGILVLCVHDSFIIAEKHKDELNNMMISTYKKYLGFEPIVK